MRLTGNEQVSARIEELKKIICDGIVRLEIRERSSRVQILQDVLDRIRQLMAARAFEYASHPGGSTGLLVRDYRGKNSDREILKFDASLVAQMREVLKQAAIEEMQWMEKRPADEGVAIQTIMNNINEGRKRVAEAKVARDREEAERLRNDPTRPRTN